MVLLLHTGLPSWTEQLVPSIVPWHAVALLAGIAFVGLAEPLSESVLFHYALCAALGSLVAAGFVAYVLYNTGRRVSHLHAGTSLFGFQFAL
jgi:hypothetical protein